MIIEVDGVILNMDNIATIKNTMKSTPTKMNTIN